MKKTILFLAIALITNLTTSAQFTTAEYLDINNVRARYMVHGDMFWNPGTGDAAYEFPKGSGKHSIHATTLWIGGRDLSTNNLNVAAHTYRTSGIDYWPGPLDEFNGSTSDSITASNWAQIWKINRSTIDSFLAITVHTISNTPKSILEWPGRNAIYSKTPSNGTLSVPDREMAPYVDVNNDNVYNPLDGDYPQIKGEQMLWWVFNDNTAAHTSSLTNPLKIEIHASAYACNQLGLKNTTFVNFRLLNWSSSILNDVIVGLWSDGDLGYSFDDYIGFDSTRRMGVMYNGDGFDESIIGYGTSLTQTGTVLLKQPTDIANTLAPVESFVSFGRSVNPQNVGANFYNYLNGLSADGYPYRKGCNLNDTNQAITKILFPDDPSIINGISEVQCNNAPFYKATVMSSAPFQMSTGNMPLDFTFAFINTDTGVDNSNFNELRRLADSAYQYVDGCNTPISPLSVPNMSNGNLKVYPNPAHNYFMIEDGKNSHKKIVLYSAYGQIMLQEESSDIKTKINTQDFANGIYYLRIESDGKQLSQTIMIR